MTALRRGGGGEHCRDETTEDLERMGLERRIELLPWSDRDSGRGGGFGRLRVVGGTREHQGQLPGSSPLGGAARCPAVHGGRRARSVDGVNSAGGVDL